MLNFRKLDIHIKAFCGDNQKDIRSFGRILQLDKGLNVVIGDNTKGKTSLASCFYYILGMEELMSIKRGANCLDRCLKDNFIWLDPNTGKEKTWYVESSYVEAEISNDKGITLLLHRDIKGDGVNDEKIYISTKRQDGKWNDRKEYFLHSRDDNNIAIEFAFYGYMAGFVGIDLPTVPRKDDKESILYLQTLFALCYVEQTRGWSDYFATIKGYNIQRPKQRIVEHALSVKMDVEYETKQILKEKRNRIKVNWYLAVKNLKDLLAYNNYEVSDLVDNIEEQKTSIDSFHIVYIGSNGKNIEEHQKLLEEEIDSFEQKKAEITQSRLPKDKILIEKYQKHKKEYDDFYQKTIIDKQKLDALSIKLAALDEEQKRIAGLKKVDNELTILQVTICPTCKQPLPITNNENRTQIDKDQLDNMSDMISFQKKFLETLKDKTEKNITQRQLHLLYIEKLLLQDKALVEQLDNELYFSASGITETELMEIARLKLELEQIQVLLKRIDAAKNKLMDIKIEYDECDKRYKSLKINERRGFNDSLSKFEVIFLEYLKCFEYKSNHINQIYLDRNENSYKYFPLVQMKDDFSEQIRYVSSASDFIRSIWAYYLSLLKNGSKHPGFLLFDEPCQQSMDESSLRRLFECGATFMDRQVIFFCSSQPHTAEQREGHKSTIINDIIVNISKKSKVNTIEFMDKAIDIIEPKI